MVIEAVYNAYAESNVIGALLLNNQCWDDIADKVSEDDFCDQTCRILFKIIKKMLTSTPPMPVEVFTVFEECKKLKLAIKEHELFTFANNVPGTRNAKVYASIVQKHAINRRLLSAMSEVNSLVNDNQDNALETAQKLIMSIGASKEGEAKAIKDLAGSVWDRMCEQSERQELLGLSSGYTAIDNVTEGFQNGDLIILAARPSMGKTTLAMNIAEYVAVDMNKPTLVFSMEMPGVQLTQRMLASRSRVNFTDIRSGNCKDKQSILRLSNSLTTFSDVPLFIDDTMALTSLEMRSRALRIKRQHGISLIVIDYLQLMSGVGENNNVIISNISRGLKALARELNVPVIALSQLNRSLEGRQDKRPMMSDLRESGAIEQDADLIMFVYRDEVYYPNSTAKGTAELNISKHRNGPTGMIRLQFEPHICRFDNYNGSEIPYAQIVQPRTKTYNYG